MQHIHIKVVMLMRERIKRTRMVLIYTRVLIFFCSTDSHPFLSHSLVELQWGHWDLVLCLTLYSTNCLQI